MMKNSKSILIFALPFILQACDAVDCIEGELNTTMSGVNHKLWQCNNGAFEIINCHEDKLYNIKGEQWQCNRSGYISEVNCDAGTQHNINGKLWQCNNNAYELVSCNDDDRLIIDRNLWQCNNGAFEKVNCDYNELYNVNDKQWHCGPIGLVEINCDAGELRDINGKLWQCNNNAYDLVSCNDNDYLVIETELWQCNNGAFEKVNCDYNELYNVNDKQWHCGPIGLVEINCDSGELRDINGKIWQCNNNIFELTHCNDNDYLVIETELWQCNNDTFVKADCKDDEIIPVDEDQWYCVHNTPTMPTAGRTCTIEGKRITTAGNQLYCIDGSFKSACDSKCRMTEYGKSCDDYCKSKGADLCFENKSSYYKYDEDIYCVSSNTGDNACRLTQAMCESANKTLDVNICECVEKGNQTQCPLTQAMCESANKTLDVNICECVEKTQPQCPLTQAMCESANKTLDANKCECVEKTQPQCPLTQAMCESANKTLDANICKCIEKTQPISCDSIKEVYHESTNTCSCNTANHWTGTAGSCTCMTGYVQIGDWCERRIYCDDTKETYNAATNTCSCNTANHWTGTAGSCTCETGYYLDGNTCKADDAQHCRGIDCTAHVHHWLDGICNAEGQCQVSTCVIGYHLYDNGTTQTCEMNNNAHCGSHGNACATGQMCSIYGTCVETGYTPPSIGDTITFGHYEQDNDTTNGKEPITWRVLDIKDGKVLLISEKTLDVQPYNTTQISITWEKSTIRSWLNGYSASKSTVGTDFTINNFIDTAFTEAEKAKIVSSNVEPHNNPSYSTSPGKATTDKIFLLSIIEANQYFKSDKERRAAATPYAIARGAFMFTSTEFQYSSLWWLRSPGDNSFGAAYVINGSVNYYGNDVDNGGHAVRPALWVNL